MGLLTQLKGQWLGILIGAGIAVVVGFYFYNLSREMREPAFAVDPGRVEIVSAASVATAPIKVLRQDGKPITSDVYAVRFYFWNEGRRSIRPGDVLDTLQVVLDDSASEILDFKLLRTSRPIAKIALERGPTDRSLVVRFAILEKGDGLSAQIIYQGSRVVPVQLRGTIEGARVRLATAPSYGTEVASTFGVLALIVVGCVATMAVMGLVVEYILKPLTRRFFPALKVPSVRVVLSLGCLAAVLLILLGAYLAGKNDAGVVTNFVPSGLVK